MKIFYRGIINLYDGQRGYGFIRRVKGKDVFFSLDDVSIHTKINLGDNIIFQITRAGKKNKATGIKKFNFSPTRDFQIIDSLMI